MDTPDFRSDMIEKAFDYLMVAKNGGGNKSYVIISLSCLALEILLKSFNSEVTDHEGEPNEKYRPNKALRSLGKDGHNLESLLRLIDKQYRDFLFSARDLELLSTYRKAFVTARYGYEKIVPREHHDKIFKLAAQTICKITLLYQDRECPDGFIANFNVSKFYFENVQRVAIY